MANAVIFRGDEAHVLDALTGLRTKRILIDDATNGGIVTGTTNTMTIEMVSVAADRTVRIPDAGKTFSMVVLTEGSYSLNGSYTFTDNVTIGATGARRYLKFTGLTADTKLYCNYENTSAWWRNGINADNGTDNSYDVYDHTNITTRIELIPGGKGIIRNDVDFTDNVTIDGTLTLTDDFTVGSTALFVDVSTKASTFGDSSISERHTIYTGDGTVGSSLASPFQPDGTITFGNLANGVASPSIFGRSDNYIGLYFGAFTTDTNFSGDMNFEIRSTSGILSNTGNIGWRWRNSSNNAMTLTRGGALTVIDDLTVGSSALFVDASTKASTFGDSSVSDRHTIYTGTASTALASIQPNGTITFGNFLSGSAVPTLIGRSFDSVALILSALSWDANTFGDMYFDIRKDGSTALGNTGNVGWRWRNFGTTAMSLTRGGALTVGDGNISDHHTFYTGGPGLTAFASPLQPNGTIIFGNSSTPALLPSIVGRSSDNAGLLLGGISYDANIEGDIIFDIKKDDGAGGTTALGNPGNTGWRWRNGSNNFMTLTRGGALTVGPSGFTGTHTLNGEAEADGTVGISGGNRGSITFLTLKELGDTNDRVSENWLLLAEAYVATDKSSDGFEGAIIQIRGGPAQFNRIGKDEVIVNSGYRSNRGGILSSHYDGIAASSLVTVDYSGTKYIALKMDNDHSRAVSVKGTIWGSLSLPILVTDASLISNEAAL